MNPIWLALIIPAAVALGFLFGALAIVFANAGPWKD